MNLLIVGRSGVGKSTLVNAIFEDDFAEIGPSEPTTPTIQKYTKEGVPLAIYDTKGLELKDYDKIVKELLEFVKDKQKQGEDQRIHVAWLCILEDGRRVEEAEKQLTQELSKLGISVIGVITKARADQGFAKEVRRLLPEAKEVVQVRAIKERIDGYPELKRMGLEELTKITSKVVPDGPDGVVLRQFIRAQKLLLKLKKKQAQKDVAKFAGLAAIAGGIPIPLVSEGLLVPIEVAMLMSISRTFRVKGDSEAFWIRLVKNLPVVSGRVSITRLLGHGLKFIPAVGTPTGGAILAFSSAMLTRSLGNWYVNFLVEKIQNGEGMSLSADIIKEGFKKFFKIQKRNSKKDAPLHSTEHPNHPGQFPTEFATGMLNILIVGRSGVGKSTLVNVIFEDDFAKTSSSEPITMATRKYTKKDVPIAIHDTTGLHLKSCDQILNDLLKQEAHQHIHVAWLCIAEDGRRVEEVEKELAQRLNKLGIPVIGVITKARADQGFENAVKRLLPPETKKVVRIRAIKETLDDGHVLQPMGLENLIEITLEVILEPLRAFIQ